MQVIQYFKELARFWELPEHLGVRTYGHSFILQWVDTNCHTSQPELKMCDFFGWYCLPIRAMSE
jgi:hypothetical protein